MASLLTTRRIVIGGISVLATPHIARAQAKTTLKMGTLGSTEYFYYKGAQRMAEEVNAKTGGALQVQVFPNNQLGSERDMVEGMQLGTIDLAVINTPLLASFNPRFMIFDMPFLFNDWAHVDRILSGTIGSQLLGVLEANDLAAFTFSTAGFRHTLNDRRRVRAPEDLQGLKIRTLDNPVHVAIMNAMGANATPMQYGEVATALHQHTVDGLDSPAPAAVTEKFYETNKFMALTGHVFTPVIYLMGLKRFRSLPAEQQQIVRDAALAGAKLETEQYNKFDAESIELLRKDHGMTIDEVDKQAFRARMAPVYDRFQDRVGKSLIESVRQAGA
jgi:tripartite ATP-independent transporter DctP family solute receptor